MTSLPQPSADSSVLMSTPALVPPPGVIPDFVHPHSDGSVVIVVGAILLAIMLVAIAVRAYSKICISRKVDWDDRASYCLILSQMLQY